MSQWIVRSIRNECKIIRCIFLSLLKKCGSPSVLFLVGGIMSNAIVPSAFVYGKNVTVYSRIDTDEDGIPDEKDACPDLKGPKSNKGCPLGIAPPDAEFKYDRDKDGVENEMDDCPEMAGPEQNNGCPPSPAQTIEHYRGAHPVYSLEIKQPTRDYPEINLPNEKDARNPYRDADHDGKRNGEDRCPFTKGTLAHYGCPQILEQEKEILKSVKEEVIYTSTGFLLNERGKDALEALVILLNNVYPEAQVRVNIYADVFAGSESNLNLGKMREKEIRKFLEEKGLDKTRIRFFNFGDLRPPKNNGWDYNARNRVEVELIFP